MAKKQRIIYTPKSSGFFDISGILYIGENCTYRISEEMTPAMNQEGLAEYYEKAKQKNDFHPTDAPLVMAIASRNYELRNENPNESERFRKFFQGGLKRYPNTLTKLIYNPENKVDKIIHNYGTSDKYSFNENIVGPDREIIKADESLLEKLLGNKDIEKVKEVFKWINKTPTWIWRLDEKPENKQERMVGFYAYSNVLTLGCNGDPVGLYPSFQVLRIE